jgi:hypothetical protein
MLKKKKYKNGPEYYILDNGNIEISQPFKSGASINIAIELQLSNFVDGYDYHDFPSTETLYFGEDDLIDAIEIFQELLNKIKEMKGDK